MLTAQEQVLLGLCITNMFENELLRFCKQVWKFQVCLVCQVFQVLMFDVDPWDMLNKFGFMSMLKSHCEC